MALTTIISPSGHIIGPLDGWRRTTGVLRAYLAIAPLASFVHPDDAQRWLRAMEASAWWEADIGPLRLGTPQRWVPCRVWLGPAPYGQRALAVAALRPLPVSAWWLDAGTYASLPAMPNRPPVWA